MKTLVIAPHADDEILGCGGTLLRRTSEGHEVGWVLLTGVSTEAGWDVAKVEARGREVERVRTGLGVARSNHFELGFPPSQLDSMPLQRLVSSIAEAVSAFGPDEIFLPFPGDAHSDHRHGFHAAAACTKWFRFPTVTRVLAYETLSETDAGLDPALPFRPNVYVDISDFIEDKLMLMQCYESETGDFPFPRSSEAIRALARLRGTSAGCDYAESFLLLRAREL